VSYFEDDSPTEVQSRDSLAFQPHPAVVVRTSDAFLVPPDGEAAPFVDALPPVSRAARRSAWRLYVLGALAIAMAALLVFGIARSRRARLAHDVAARKQESQLGARVLVAKIESTPGQRAITLLGEVQPYRQATLYAKVSGYLKEVRVDKGDKVREGQILGVLESPEADQRVVANRADYAAKAQTAARYRRLLKQGVVSEQEMERATADLDVTAADGTRLRAMKDYAFIRAPFDGVMISRNADPGALLQAATSSTQSAMALGEIADLSRVRVRVYLGAYDAPFVHERDAVTLWSDAQPDKKTTAAVTRLTRALDARTRTMLVEIDLDNADGALYAGAPIHVSLRVASPPSLVVPAEAVIVRHAQPMLAVVRGGRAVFVPVEAGDDDGTTVRVRGAVNEGEIVALRVADDVAEGAVVQPILKAAGGPKGK
jgi:RND family efflux transporter MFP subunit